MTKNFDNKLVTIIKLTHKEYDEFYNCKNYINNLIDNNIYANDLSISILLETINNLLALIESKSEIVNNEEYTNYINKLIDDYCNKQ